MADTEALKEALQNAQLGLEVFRQELETYERRRDQQVEKYGHTDLLVKHEIELKKGAIEGMKAKIRKLRGRLGLPDEPDATG